jgi:hypothetical protein
MHRLTSLQSSYTQFESNCVAKTVLDTSLQAFLLGGAIPD